MSPKSHKKGKPKKWDKAAFKTFQTFHPVHLLFSQTKKNYDVGNHKMLSIKEANNGKLETVARGCSTSLSYPYKYPKEIWNVRNAKWLNTRQVHWAFFFACFHIMLTYYPRLRNGKADVPSQMFGGPKEKRLEVRKMCLVVPVRWKMWGWNRQLKQESSQ